MMMGRSVTIYVLQDYPVRQQVSVKVFGLFRRQANTKDLISSLNGLVFMGGIMGMKSSAVLVHTKLTVSQSCNWMKCC